MADFAFSGQSWPLSQPITWSFATINYAKDSTSPFSTTIGTAYQAVISQALQTWASVSGLQFLQVADAITTDIRIGFAYLQTPSTKLVGMTTSSFLGATFRPDTIIRLEDPGETSLVSNANGGFTYQGLASTLSQVILHELGHALGLAHSTDLHSIMFPTAGSSNAVLDASDILGITTLYPAAGASPSTPGAQTTIVVSLPNQTVQLAGGSTKVTLTSTGAIVLGDAGSDNVTDAGIGSTINLGTGRTTVNATSGGPRVFGSSTSGSLFFSGGSAAATVYAGAGATTLFANAGGGQFFAGAAASMLFVGGTGASTVVGGAGSTTLFGGSGGHDLLVAGSGPSTVVGSGSGVVLVGRGIAGDVLVAGAGAETLVGSADGGGDIMFAGTGPDALFGGTGSDTFVGASGGAQMIAGPNHAGSDRFIFSNGAARSTNVIWNFIQGQDRVALFGYGNTAVADALANATVAAGSTSITLTDSTRITFSNLPNLKSTDFL